MRGVALVVALALASQAGETNPITGRPKSVRMAVLPIVIQGQSGATTISSIFNDVVSASEMRIGLRIISYEEMFAAAEEGLGDRVRDCGSDIGCISSRLRTFNARLGLVVVSDLSSKPPLISLQLLDTDDGRMLASSVGQIEGKESLSQSIQKRTKEILEKAGYGLAGRVLVDVDPPSARVTLGNGIEPDQGTPNHFTVAPGHYAVGAAADGFSSGRKEVDVTSGSEATIKLSLDKQTSILESPFLWIGVGVAAVLGTGAVLIATHKTSYCLCLKLKDSSCACPE